ncbi:hypothetical protein SAMN04515647_3811 [Cohaesibacter sp. ES.047]|uniref:hypothetical protein n=1 Tax=Cohaesibacter sp. ES.047 TaxID=1798205 RepID=UPI000BB810EB|nr:hypothetical protein [Cohaesibacter sp. ES.047]SNY93512.1 hypothetical protein SAMN04515647_3811 [Cohaesibacter sp. ES.047]
MSQTGMQLQDMIGNLQGDHSWEALDNLMGTFGHPERKKLAKEDQARREAIANSYRHDLLAIFATPEGRRVLDHMIAGTLGRPPVNFAQAGLSADQVGVMAAYRDGQNTVVHALLTDLAAVGFDPSDKGDAA